MFDVFSISKINLRIYKSSAWCLGGDVIMLEVGIYRVCPPKAFISLGRLFSLKKIATVSKVLLDL